MYKNKNKSLQGFRRASVVKPEALGSILTSFKIIKAKVIERPIERLIFLIIFSGCLFGDGFSSG